MKGVLTVTLAFLLFTPALYARVSNRASIREGEGKRFAPLISGQGGNAGRFLLQSQRRKARRRRNASPVAGEISFQTLIRSAPAGTEPNAPSVFVANSNDDLQSFVRLLSPEHVQQVSDGVDFSSQAVVAVFAGAKGSSGYEILVERIKVVNGQLQITVRLKQPAAQDYALQVLTSPYHIVRVPKEALKGVTTSSWILVDTEGSRLAASQSN